MLTGAVVWSDETYRIYGFEPGSVIPTSDVFFTLVHPEDRSGVEEAFARVVRDRSAYELDFRILRPDGQVRYIHSVGHPIFNAAGDLTEVMGTVLDRTEQQGAADALQQAQADLAHLMRVLTLGALMTSIAHEVNQPLAAIMADAEAGLRWLDRATPALEAGQEALRGIVTNCQRAGDIIARLRAALHKAPLHVEPLDLRPVIAEVLALTHHEVQRQQVHLRTDLAADLLRVWGDRVQVQQVLLNLVLNGLEAMSAVMDRPRELLIRAAPTGTAQVCVAVQDAGMGVDPPMLERIFAPFVTTKPAGLGMGLAISRTIIEAHGGRLWAERNPGPGTTVQFTLPTAGAPEHA